MPKFVMMIGLPGIGKSTYAKEHYPDYELIDTDSWIEKYASENGVSYNEIFKKFFPKAESEMYNKLQACLESGKNMVWDQTNLTIASRIRKISKVIDYGYSIEYVVFPPNLELALERNSMRQNKKIPEEVIRSMIINFEYPDLEREKWVNKIIMVH